MSEKERAPEKSFFQRHALTIKVLLIGLLTLMLLIPLAMVQDLIEDRERMSDGAIEEVSGKWSGPQTIIGPILTIPFMEKSPDNDRVMARNYLHILPDQLHINGSLTTEELKRGLYEISVYNAPLGMTGSFSLPTGFSTTVPAANLLMDEATLNIGFSDMRGIGSQIEMQWGAETLKFSPGISINHILSSGVTSPVDLKSMHDRTVDFSVKLQIRGSSNLMFAPIGKTTTVNLRSNSATPSFVGAFLPETREVTSEGFTSTWKVIDLNRNYPQQLVGNHWNETISDTEFGVSLLFPVYQYQMAMRSVKYAVLIILLTFVVSFFIEIRHKRSIHPFQYLLVGLALCLFYTLLVSLSEHLSFSLSYLIAASMTVALITLYMFSIVKNRRSGLTLGALLAALYGYIFVLIRMETYALLVGSVGLFVILALIMYYSQKINWSNNS